MLIEATNNSQFLGAVYVTDECTRKIRVKENQKGKCDIDIDKDIGIDIY